MGGEAAISIDPFGNCVPRVNGACMLEQMEMCMATQKHSKLTQYLMSERFQKNMRRGIAKAIAETRAAGLEPAGDRRIKGPSGPSIVTVIAAPKPLDRAKRRR